MLPWYVHGINQKTLDTNGFTAILRNRADIECYKTERHRKTEFVLMNCSLELCSFVVLLVCEEAFRPDSFLNVCYSQLQSMAVEHRGGIFKRNHIKPMSIPHINGESRFICIQKYFQKT